MLTASRPIPPVVLVDDEEELLFTSKVLLRNHGIGPITTLQDSRKLLGYLEEHGASLVLLDLIMPNITGIELLPEIQRHFPEIPVVVMTAVHEVETAVSCMKEGHSITWSSPWKRAVSSPVSGAAWNARECSGRYAS